MGGKHLAKLSWFHILISDNVSSVCGIQSSHQSIYAVNVILLGGGAYGNDPGETAPMLCKSGGRETMASSQLLPLFYVGGKPTIQEFRQSRRLFRRPHITRH